MELTVTNEHIATAVKRYVEESIPGAKVKAVKFVAAPAKSGGIRAEVELAAIDETPAGASTGHSK